MYANINSAQTKMGLNCSLERTNYLILLHCLAAAVCNTCAATRDDRQMCKNKRDLPTRHECLELAFQSLKNSMA